MKLLIMSDIHGNLAALTSVLEDVRKNFTVDACVLLGDLIDYGMHSNETVQMIRSLPYELKCNIWGNHEDAIAEEHYDRFSSLRGQECAKYTRSVLNDETWAYIRNEMTKSGMAEFQLPKNTANSEATALPTASAASNAGMSKLRQSNATTNSETAEIPLPSAIPKNCLAIHGSLADAYWKSIFPDVDPEPYAKYDYVFSGHSHYPHFFERYVASENAVMRNKKKIIFINPGSVGQPRNQNPHAQYAVFDTDTEEIVFRKVPYDIAKEQAEYHGQVDDFYRERLGLGI